MEVNPDERARPVAMLARLFAPHWRALLLIAGLGAGAALLTMATAELNRAVVDRLADPGAVYRLTSAWAAVVIAAAALGWASAWALFSAGRAIAAPLADRLFERLLRRSPREHERAEAGQGHTLLSRCIVEIGYALSTGLASAVAHLALGAGALLGMARMNSVWALAAAPPIAFAWIGARALGRRQAALVHELIDHERLRIDLTDEVLRRERFAVIKRNALEHRFADSFASLTRRYEALQRRRRLGFSLYSHALVAAPLVAVPAIWAAGGARGVSAGTVVAFAALMPQALVALNGISQWYVSLADSAPYLRRVLDLLDGEPDPAPHADPSIRAADLAGAPLVLSGVRCARGGRQVLRGVELVVRPGSHHVIVGPNGAGKSTLLEVVTGLVPAAAGTTARIGGIPIARIPRAVLAEHVRAVDSSPVVFTGSVRDNVTLLAPLASASDVERACGVARIGFPLERPAERLSTGQKIQMLVAQAVLPRPWLLLLDEGLKHLHPTTRVEIRDALRRELPGAAVVEVSHAGAVRAAGATIHVLEDGVIAESGTHDELMRLGGRYARYVADSER